MKHELPPLPYAYDALEPHIDARTIEIHHTKHHQAYVNKLNEALENYPELQDRSVEELIGSPETIPAPIRTAVRNNGGGHYSHALYWHCMGPEGKRLPAGPLMEGIIRSFGSFDAFKERFDALAVGLFGSGWVWFAKNGDALEVLSTSGHDTPLMQGKLPLLVIDIWEHAYYLNYQNRRQEYIANWWNVVDWQTAEDRFASTIK